MPNASAHHIAVDEPVGYHEENYDIESEIRALLLLEAEAAELSSAIVVKTEAIAECLRRRRDRATLKRLLEQCDGLVCAVRVIAERICVKMGISTVPNLAYLQVQHDHMQKSNNLSHEKENSGLSFKNSMASQLSTHTSVRSAGNMQATSIVHPRNVLLTVLGFLATVIGLAALVSLIRKSCMSAHRRAEYAADAEERRKERTYRRAARRARMRRIWDAFVVAISCSRAEPEKWTDNHEEKQALIILPDAFLEQESEAVEHRDDIMEAEIRELRHAHELVSFLVRETENDYNLVAPARHPWPPPLPLVSPPYTPATRSRASSTTLPSYTSEQLPDYTSRYGRTARRSLISCISGGGSGYGHSGGGHSSGVGGGGHSSSIGISSNGSSDSSSRGSVRSDSLVTGYLEQCSATRGSDDETTSTPQPGLAERIDYERQSEDAATSSVCSTSPRPSEETLQAYSWFSPVSTISL